MQNKPLKKRGGQELPYKTIQIRKSVPESIHDKCLSLLDAEILKFKLKNK